MALGTLPARLKTAEQALSTLADAGLEFTEVGLRFVNGPPDYETWSKAGSLLVWVDQRARLALNFALGDWYNCGMQWGEKAEQVATDLPEYKYSYIRMCAYVASRFQFEKRFSNCAWTEYLLLAPEPEENRFLVLDTLAAGTLTPEERRHLLSIVRKRRIAEKKEHDEKTAPQLGPDFGGSDTEMTAQEAGEIVAAQLREHAQKPPEATETGDSDGDVFSDPGTEDAQAELAMAVGRIEDLEKQVADLEAKDTPVHVQGTHLVSEEVHLTTYSKAAMMAYEKLHPTLPRPAILEEWARFVMRHLGLEIRG